MDLLFLEELAVETYRRHKFDPARPVSLYTLAREMYGDDVIVRPNQLVGARPANAGWSHGKVRIGLRRTVPPEEAQHYIGHELSHLLLGRPHTGDAALEAACDYLGAALMAPRPAVLALYRAFGWSIREIADEVVATQTWAALRLGEALRVPLAAVSPATVRVRGPEGFVWPAEGEIRKLAKRPGPGLHKVRVTDRPARAVLVADG